MVAHLYPPGKKLPNGIVASVPAPFVLVGRLLADGAIVARDGDADIIFVTNNEYESSRLLADSARGELKRRCPACQLTEVDAPVAQWATKIQSETQAALQRAPDADFLIATYDAMQQWAVPGIKAAGAADRVESASYNGVPFVLKQIQQGDVVRFTIGESADQLAYANMDQALRLLTGMRPVKDPITPLRIFDSSNVGQTGRPPKDSKGYGTDYVNGYLKLWGVR
jgi:ribose transport system substrate-binding protein